MSEQRRLRSELRQGLHQFLMQMYTAYTSTMTEEEAKELIQSIIEEQYEYFSTEKIQALSAKEALAEKVQELTDKIESVKDYDTQLYYAEKIDVLQTALEVLDFKIS